MTELIEWSPASAAALVKVPGEDDDKYSRGVLGVITGSEQYPGAAVLGVEAALQTGVGMVRYLGPAQAADLVLARRPEAVTAEGRVQAWLIGSGTDHAGFNDPVADAAVQQGLPTVLDGGALSLWESRRGPLVLTPHYLELARLLSVSAEQVAADPAAWAVTAAEQLEATVLLKGHSTFIAGPGIRLVVRSAPTWLATAGAGDALGGVLGALLATHSSEIAADDRMPARLAATASFIHGRAAQRASAGGPLTILDLCASIPATIAELIADQA